jgi:signal transduction histidine kinase
MGQRSMVRNRDHTILVVNDQEEPLVSVRSLLECEGYRVLAAADSAVALDLFVREHADILLIEQAMVERDSAQLLRRVRLLDDGVPVVVSGRALDAAHRRRLMRRFDLHGIYDQNTDSSMVLELIESALASSRRVRNARVARELRDLILVKFCHDLRNSLHVIRGYTEILCGDPETVSVEGILDRLGVASDTALGLAEDYLDLARLDASGVIVRREAVDIDALLDDLRALSSRQIGRRPVQFTTDVPFPGAVMCTDGEKVRATLAQLLANAIKFTPSGEVRLTVRSAPGRTDFVLTDAGPGIKQDALPDILSPVCQFRHDVAATAPGQGVGLAIALRLSALIGASLTATSDSGGAAIFTLSLPEAVSRRAEAHEPTLH